MSDTPLQDHLLWIDLEATGSNVEHDCIIEIGCVLTTHDLEELGEFTAVVKPEPLGLGRMLQNSVVKNMHEKNGLIADVLETTDDDKIHKVTLRLIDWLKSFPVEEGKIALAGSGVGHYDKKFIDKYMPQLSKMLRYWVIDVGIFRRSYELWIGEDPFKVNNEKTHRALDDAKCHLKEAQLYRTLWTPHV